MDCPDQQLKGQGKVSYVAVNGDPMAQKQICKATYADVEEALNEDAMLLPLCSAVLSSQLESINEL